MIALRSLLVLSLVSLLSSSAHATSGWVDVVQRVGESLVPITYRGGEGGCSGVVINREKHYVLTANHCIADIMWIDLVPATLIAADTQQDLMVLEVKDLDRPALRLSDRDPVIGQEVGSFGYGYGLITWMFRRATISAVGVHLPDIKGGPFVLVDSAFVGGMSGGPVVNESGEMVLYVQRANSLVGVGVSADIIRQRVGKYFEKPKTP